jgi:eukaryotic-like serine/threonine-protein kinase
VTRVRRDPGVLIASGPTNASDAASAIFVNAQPAPSGVAPSGVRLAPWVVSGVSLLAAASLLGMLVARRPVGEPEAPVRIREPTAVVEVPPVVETPEVAAVATTTIVAPPVTAKASRHTVVYVPSPRRTVVEAPTPAPVRPAALVSAPPAPGPVSAPPPKTDCDPPFYFDGAKKVFKTNCI